MKKEMKIKVLNGTEHAVLSEFDALKQMAAEHPTIKVFTVENRMKRIQENEEAVLGAFATEKLALKFANEQGLGPETVKKVIMLYDKQNDKETAQQMKFTSVWVSETLMLDPEGMKKAAAFVTLSEEYMRTETVAQHEAPYQFVYPVPFFSK